MPPLTALPALSALPVGTIPTATGVGVLVVAGACLLAGQLPTSDGHPWRALTGYGLALAIVLAGLVWSRPGATGGQRFGPANAVTLLRTGMICVLAALIGEPWQPNAWWVAGLAIVALSLDGVDGWLARRYGPLTAFGARFDMEADALLGLVLATLCWQAGLAGAWVLLAGLWRYAFVAAAWVLPWLNRPLPPSGRRKLLCVLQLVALIACIAPTLPPALRTGCAALAVVLVSGSFLVDIGWLARHRPR